LAVFFLDLHRKENPTVFSEESIKQEYDWAHTYCNAVKNDIPFITEKFTPEGNIEKWVVYDVGILDMLENIKNGAHLRGYPETYIFDNAWKEKRFEKIRNRIDAILLTEINTQDTPILTYMLGLLKCSDPERLHPYGKLALQDKSLPPKRQRSASESLTKTRKAKVELFTGKRTLRNKNKKG